MNQIKIIINVNPQSSSSLKKTFLKVQNYTRTAFNYSLGAYKKNKEQQLRCFFFASITFL